MPVEIITDTTDLLVVKDESFGQLEDDVFGPSFFISLRNFPLNSHALRPTHVEVLRDRVTFELKKPVMLGEFYGMTDRSGSRAINYKVAAERLAAVQDALLPFGAPFAKFHHSFCKAVGEDFWENRHDQDPTERIFNDNLQDSEFRCVMIEVSPAPIGVPTRIFRTRAAQEILVFCRAHTQKR
jgi:hypothetical protein